MQRETMKMISKTKEPFEAPDFEPMEDEIEEEFGKRRTTVRFGGGDDDHGWSSGSSLSKSALKSIQESPESKRSTRIEDGVPDITATEPIDIQHSLKTTMRQQQTLLS